MRISLAALLVLALTTPQAPGLAESLNEYVTLFAGPGAIDCGQVGSPATNAALQQLIDCGLAAAKRRQSFRAEQRSWEIAGLIGDASGVISHFRMAAGCADGSCPAMFSIARCPSPSSDRGDLRCYGQGTLAVSVEKPDAYLDVVAGSGATDCGRLGIRATEADLRRSLDCALEANRRREAFSLVKQDQGIDSSIYQGLVGNRAGTMFLFTYDSAPCGNPQCYGSFSLGKCPGPTTTMRGNRLHFSCSQ
ncbi:MAG TPA: hypothetical protein VJN96_24280 [Vicinamibacterales bacterium]|nr:hypothetical protein [Vicinamibacterales bacterium]